MTRIVYKSLSEISPSSPPAGVTERIVQVNADASMMVHVLDARRDSFGSDLAYVFGRNVARAREENEQLTGSPDGTLVRD